MTEGVDATFAIRQVVLGPGEDHARRAEHDRERPGPGDAGTDRGRRLIPGARGDRNALEGAHQIGALGKLRQPPRWDVEPGQQFAAPEARPDIEEQRARCIGHIHAVRSGQVVAHEVLGQADPADAFVCLGLVLAHPEQLRRGEARQRAVTGEP